MGHHARPMSVICHELACIVVAVCVDNFAIPNAFVTAPVALKHIARYVGHFTFAMTLIKAPVAIIAVA